MLIQRSLRVSSEERPGNSIAKGSMADCPPFLRRAARALGLLLPFLLLAGCDALPFRNRLPELPFLPWQGEPVSQAQELRVFLIEEGEVTQALRARVDAWAAEREIQVEVSTSASYTEELRRSLREDRPPDLFVVTGFLFPDLVEQGLLAPAEDGFYDPAGYPPNLAAAFVWPEGGGAGHRYCLPREVRTLGLVYDSAGLAGSGLAPPTDWEALRTVAIEQTDVERNRFGLIESPDLSRWLPFLFAAGGTIIDAGGGLSVQSDAAAAAMDWYIQIFRDNFAGHAGESNNEWAGEVLGKGKGALTIEGNWIAPYFEAEFPDFRYGVAPLPTGPGGRNTTVAFTSCYAVSADSPWEREAFALAAFLSSPAVVAALPNDGSWMPAITAQRDEWREKFPLLAPFADSVNTAWVWQLPPGFETLVNSFNRGMVQLFAAQIEASDFLAEMQALGESLRKAPDEGESN